MKPKLFLGLDLGFKHRSHNPSKSERKKRKGFKQKTPGQRRILDFKTAFLRSKMLSKRRLLPAAAVILMLLILALCLLGLRMDTEEQILQCCASPAKTPKYQYAKEVRQVVFAKVHKAASSTIQNILLRFAMSRNLSLLLPVEGTLFSEWTSQISPENVLPHPTGETMFDMLTVHVLYNQSEMDKYFPKSAFRVAIVRDPLQHAVSALAYYSTVWPYTDLTAGLRKHRADPVTGLLMHPEDFSGIRGGCPELGSWVANRMSYDLGVLDHSSSAHRLRHDYKALRDFVDSLHKQFNLVLIADFFDESIVLLRRRLGWSMKDILYLTVNALPDDQNSVWRKQPDLTPDQLTPFKQCNKIDYEVFDHFLNLFFDIIGGEAYFQQEVDAFRAVQQKVKKFCKHGLKKTLVIPAGAWNEKFVVKRCDCLVMEAEELHLVQAAKRKQLRLYEAFKAFNKSDSTLKAFNKKNST
ncbi:hypothetical protein EGW08_013147 [Elysia chlorotica]|uniref:Sulfotransferase domain-containing protein n=1 Tax=Elysia chlorotica TaxID=188477 RepID=A0A3S1BAS2_ELYCH|nr:hypothetical protein EGW08_013147 [Elysia chlorotica]